MSQEVQKLLVNERASLLTSPPPIALLTENEHFHLYNSLHPGFKKRKQPSEQHEREDDEDDDLPQYNDTALPEPVDENQHNKHESELPG